MAEIFSFDDAFRRLVDVSDRLVDGRMGVDEANAHTANFAVFDKMMNTAIKIRLAEISSGNQLPNIGDIKIFDRKPINGDVVSESAMKLLASVPVEPPAAPRTRKPKLGFVGLSATEAGSIAAAFGEHADLLFWKDEGIPKLKPLAKCDVVFANLSQVSHKTTEYLTANGLAEGNLVKVSGGVSAMKYAVKARFENGGSKS